MDFPTDAFPLLPSLWTVQPFVRAKGRAVFVSAPMVFIGPADPHAAEERAHAVLIKNSVQCDGLVLRKPPAPEQPKPIMIL
jgi:hypothetical protein